MSTNMRQEFISAAERKDIPYLRSYIASEIINDPTFKKSLCDECMEYLANCGLDITESYQLDSIETPTPTDESLWDKRLFLSKVEFLRTNFAYERRIKELRKIGPVAYAEDVVEETPNFTAAPKGRRSEKKNSSLAAVIGTVAAVAAIIAVIALLMKK